MAFFCLLALIVAAEVRGNTIVNTKYGQIEGHRVNLTDGSEVLSFLGVPYGKAPIGELRFQPPQEPEAWTGVRQAARLGPVCPQSGGVLSATHPVWDRFSEDCLNINIFTPYPVTTTSRLPVMIFFHGGSYRGGANIQYPGHFFARRGVVSVVANYRLDKLGFLSTGDDVAPGNYGVMDQILSMRFVQENIVNFGGDPDRVTVFGHSAGAASVGLHLVSPMSAGLFKQAMMHSGNDLTIWSHHTPEIARNLTNQVALQLGCPVDDSRLLVDCMRNQTAEDIVRTGWERYPGQFTLGFIPTVDGAGGFLPDSPINLRERGEFNKDIPVLAGNTNDEAGVAFIPVEDGLNRTLFRDAIRALNYAALINYGEDKVEEVNRAVISHYTRWPNADDLIANRDALIQAANDVAFGSSMDGSLKFQSQFATTYEYRFGFRSPILDAILPEWTGTFHAADVPYLFGHPFLLNEDAVADDMELDLLALIPWTDEDIEYAGYWLDLLSNFAKTGNPTPSPVPAPGNNTATTWSTFTTPNSQQLNYLDVTKTTVDMKQNLFQRNDAFWQKYIAYILSRGQQNMGMSMGVDVSQEDDNGLLDDFSELLDETFPQILY